MSDKKPLSPPKTWMYIAVVFITASIAGIIIFLSIKLFLLVITVIVLILVSHEEYTQAKEKYKESTEESPDPQKLTEFSEKDVIEFGGRTIHRGACDQLSLLNGNMVIKKNGALYLKGEDVDKAIYPDGKKIFESSIGEIYDIQISDNGVIIVSQQQVVFIPFNSY